MRPQREHLARFFAHVHRNSVTCCWIWTGCRKRRGYAQLKITGTGETLAHRLAYRWFVGPIVDGFELDHLCMNTGCVNPAHLEPVSHAENVSRWAKVASHCKNGHPRTPENAMLGRSDRCCRLCVDDYQRKYRERKRAFAATRMEATL